MNKSSDRSISGSSSGSAATASTSTTSTTVVKDKWPKKIFLNIAPMTTKEGLWFEMNKIGKVCDIFMPMSKYHEGRHRGFAFITFQWHEDAAYAIERLQGTTLDGLILKPQWAVEQTKKDDKNKDKKKNHRFQGQKRNGSKKRRDFQIPKDLSEERNDLSKKWGFEYGK